MDGRTPLDRILALSEPLAAELGLYVYDVELYRGRRAKLRVLADRLEKAGPSDGVTVRELAALSRAVDRALELDRVLGDDFALEVSSPGLERKLKTPAHFAGAVGEHVEVVTAIEIDKRTHFVGRLSQVGEESLVVETGKGPISVLLAQVKRARTVFKSP